MLVVLGVLLEGARLWENLPNYIKDRKTRKSF